MKDFITSNSIVDLYPVVNFAIPIPIMTRDTFFDLGGGGQIDYFLTIAMPIMEN